MNKRLVLALGVILALMLSTTNFAAAALPLTPTLAQTSWQGAYWNNTTLSGSPALCCVTYTGEYLDFDWGFDAPDPDVNGDHFSARWTRTIDLAAGDYRFTATSDDGIRVYVDDKLILDGWWDHGVRTFTVDQTLSGGLHTLAVEYYERTGRAVAKVSWELVSANQATPGHWLAEYYDNREMAGRPILVRDDTAIDFDWGIDSPKPGIVPADDFSVRWTRTVDLPAGLYQFWATTDDGVRVYVDEELILDGWWDHSEQTFKANKSLAAGEHTVTVEYYEHLGTAKARVGWVQVQTTPKAKTTSTWRGEYFDNKYLSGEPKLVRDDAEIKFDWGTGSPAPNVIGDNLFSVRWTRDVYFKEGRYRFITTTDDGVRLFIDGNLIIDKWRLMPRTQFKKVVHLGEGWHTIRMEYFEEGGFAVAKLRWEKVEPQPAVGNLITCVPPNPPHYAWIKVYRLEADGTWVRVIPKGVGSIVPSGYLKIDGLPVDIYRYGGAGHPYWIERWIDGRLVDSVGNFQRGEPEFRIRAGADNYTSWACPGP
jgi:hypothetical protein